MTAPAPRALLLTDDPEPIRAVAPLKMHWHPPTPGRPEARARCAILCLPIQGGDYDVSTYFACFFASLGFHALRFERREEWLDASRTIPEMGHLAQQYVRDIQRGTDQWLAMPEVPDLRLGLFGVSMGAKMGTVVSAALGDRLHARVLCIGGADMADVLMRGRDEEIDRFRADMLARLQVEPDELRRRFAEVLDPIDAALHAPHVDTDTTLFVAARFDRVVPWSNSVRLWQALGRPKRVILPTGHYSAALFIPWIRSLSRRWFDRLLVN